MKILSRDLGVDLGTANILVYADGKGVVLREPSVVAVDKNTGKILQVGAAARNMLGRTPGNVVAMRPLLGGVISDYEMTQRMLAQFFRKASRHGLFKPRVIVSVPSSITEVEERAVIGAAMEAGARRVYLIEEPLAAALGANLDIAGPGGHMVVDIGGGTTDVAVLSMNAVAVSSSTKVAGDAMDEAIMRYVRRKHGVVLGEKYGRRGQNHHWLRLSPAGKCQYAGQGQGLAHRPSQGDHPPGRGDSGGSEAACPADCGRDFHRAGANAAGIGGGFGPERHCAHGRRQPHLGHGAADPGADGASCILADDADSCVAYGCGKSLAWINHMQEGTINLARRRLMQA